MRTPEPMGYYAIRDAENLPRVVHAVKERAPKNGIEISKEQAEAISGAYRTGGPRKRRPSDEGMAIAVLTEAKDQIVAIVNEASSERDAAYGELATRVRMLEAIIDAIGQKAGQILEKPE